MLVLENPPSVIQPLEGGFRVPNHIATAERKVLEIIQINCKLPPYYAVFQLSRESFQF